MSTSILAQSADFFKRTFHDWKNVPNDYKTRSAWKRAFRRVAKGEKPTAVVLVEQTRKFDTIDAEYTVEKQYKLFHLSQTRPIRQTPLNTAQRQFWERFVRHGETSSEGVAKL